MFQKIKAETFPTGMKAVNFIFGKGVVVFNTVSKEVSGTFPLSDWLKMFCRPYFYITSSNNLI